MSLFVGERVREALLTLWVRGLYVGLVTCQDSIPLANMYYVYDFVGTDSKFCLAGADVGAFGHPSLCRA